MLGVLEEVCGLLGLDGVGEENREEARRGGGGGGGRGGGVHLEGGAGLSRIKRNKEWTLIRKRRPSSGCAKSADSSTGRRTRTTSAASASRRSSTRASRRFPNSWWGQPRWPQRRPSKKRRPSRKRPTRGRCRPGATGAGSARRRWASWASSANAASCFARSTDTWKTTVATTTTSGRHRPSFRNRTQSSPSRSSRSSE